MQAAALHLWRAAAFSSLKKKIEPLRREEREGFLYESGTPADRALAGDAIRPKGSYWQRDFTAANGDRPYVNT